MANEKQINEVKSRVFEYVEAVETGTRKAGKLEKLAIKRFKNDLATGATWSDDEKIYFDTDAATKAVLFFNHLRHFKGEFAGRPFILPGWQAFIIYNLFGWKKASNGKRRFNEAYIEVSKKNGKSTFAAGVQLLMLLMDGEAGAEIYSAASSRKQAGIVLDTAIEIAKKSPQIKKRVGILAKAITVEETASFIQAVSSEADNIEGNNTHCAIIDEYHVHKTSEVKDNLRSGMAGRAQPLMLTITTAGFNRFGPCYLKRQTSVKILEGIIKDESQFIIIYTIDEGDEWTDPENFEKANPNLGANPSLEFLKGELKTALNEGGTKETNFKTKHLNVWTDAASVWIQAATWNQGAAPLPMEELEGAQCFGGLDLSSVRDLTAYVLYFPFDENKNYILPFFWMPELNYEERVKKDNVNYNIWIDQGFIRTTPGNAIDYDFILADILAINEKYNVKKVAFDRWNSASIVPKLINEGVNLEQFGQGFGSMNGPTKELEAKVLRGEIIHGGNPVLAWMCSNVEIEKNPAGDIKINKKKSAEKVDGMVSLVMALAMASQEPEEVPGVTII